MELAFTVEKRVGVMEEGKVVCNGTPDEVKNDEYVQKIYLGKGGTKNE